MIVYKTPAEVFASLPPQPLRQTLLVQGMHGRGDCLHSRALVRQWLDQDYDVYLESSWVSLFHDFIDRGLKVIRKPTPLRTQIKNARREMNGFYAGSVPSLRVKRKRIWYPPDMVRRYGSVLAAMCASNGMDYKTADFRIPVKTEWVAEAKALLAQWGAGDRPLLIFRPPSARPEWGGAAARNPDPEAYAELFADIRKDYFVLSIADFEPGKEWLVGPQPDCDIACHRGELNTEQLLGLFSLARLVFTTGGFCVIMAQAVETPVITVMGGYEDSRSYLGGARYSPYLGIDTVQPCRCFKHDHACVKTIDVPLAKVRIAEFVAQHCNTSSISLS